MPGRVYPKYAPLAAARETPAAPVAHPPAADSARVLYTRRIRPYMACTRYDLCYAYFSMRFNVVLRLLLPAIFARQYII